MGLTQVQEKTALLHHFAKHGMGLRNGHMADWQVQGHQVGQSRFQVSSRSALEGSAPQSRSAIF